MASAATRPVLVRVQAGLSGRVEVKLRAVDRPRRQRSCMGSILRLVLRLLCLAASLLGGLLAYDVGVQVQRDPLRGAPVWPYVSRVFAERSEVWRAVGQELAQRTAQEAQRLRLVAAHRTCLEAVPAVCRERCPARWLQRSEAGVEARAEAFAAEHGPRWAALGWAPLGEAAWGVGYAAAASGAAAVACGEASRRGACLAHAAACDAAEARCVEAEGAAAGAGAAGGHAGGVPPRARAPGGAGGLGGVPPPADWVAPPTGWPGAAAWPPAVRGAHPWRDTEWARHVTLGSSEYTVASTHGEYEAARTW